MYPRRGFPPPPNQGGAPPPRAPLPPHSDYPPGPSNSRPDRSFPGPNRPPGNFNDGLAPHRDRPFEGGWRNQPSGSGGFQGRQDHPLPNYPPQGGGYPDGPPPARAPLPPDRVMDRVPEYNDRCGPPPPHQGRAFPPAHPNPDNRPPERYPESPYNDRRDVQHHHRPPLPNDRGDGPRYPDQRETPPHQRFQNPNDRDFQPRYPDRQDQPQRAPPPPGRDLLPRQSERDSSPHLNHQGDRDPRWYPDQREGPDPRWANNRGSPPPPQGGPSRLGRNNSGPIPGFGRPPQLDNAWRDERPGFEGERFDREREFREPPPNGNGSGGGRFQEGPMRGNEYQQRPQQGFGERFPPPPGTGQGREGNGPPMDGRRFDDRDNRGPNNMHRFNDHDQRHSSQPLNPSPNSRNGRGYEPLPYDRPPSQTSSHPPRSGRRTPTPPSMGRNDHRDRPRSPPGGAHASNAESRRGRSPSPAGVRGSEQAERPKARGRSREDSGSPGRNGGRKRARYSRSPSPVSQSSRSHRREAVQEAADRRGVNRDEQRIGQHGNDRTGPVVEERVRHAGNNDPPRRVERSISPSGPRAPPTGPSNGPHIPPNRFAGGPVRNWGSNAPPNIRNGPPQQQQFGRNIQPQFPVGPRGQGNFMPGQRQGVPFQPQPQTQRAPLPPGRSLDIDITKERGRSPDSARSSSSDRNRPRGRSERDRESTDRRLGSSDRRSDVGQAHGSRSNRGRSRSQSSSSEDRSHSKSARSRSKKSDLSRSHRDGERRSRSPTRRKTVKGSRDPSRGGKDRSVSSAKQSRRRSESLSRSRSRSRSTSSSPRRRSRSPRRGDRSKARRPSESSAGASRGKTRAPSPPPTSSKKPNRAPLPPQGAEFSQVGHSNNNGRNRSRSNQNGPNHQNGANGNVFSQGPTPKFYPSGPNIAPPPSAPPPPVGGLDKDRPAVISISLKKTNSAHAPPPISLQLTDEQELSKIRRDLVKSRDQFTSTFNATALPIRGAFEAMIRVNPALTSNPADFLQGHFRRRPEVFEAQQLRLLLGQKMIVDAQEEQERQISQRIREKTRSDTQEAAAAQVSQAAPTGAGRWKSVSSGVIKTKEPEKAPPVESMAPPPHAPSTPRDPAPPASSPRAVPMEVDPTIPKPLPGTESPFSGGMASSARTPVAASRLKERVSARERSPEESPGPDKKSASGEAYEKLVQVGEGTYGKVYKARSYETGGLVALKRIRMEGEKDGFPVTAMREIKLLQGIRHPNILRLHEMMVSKGSVYMVFEYMHHDLTGVLSQPQFSFQPAHLKSLCQQMLLGLQHLHDNSILHRDIKGSNILLNARGELKLADFGLARLYHKKRRDDYTNRVITLWYRSPELLLGETMYGPCVDMWSAGCIFLELFTHKPIFQGNDEIHQLEVIYALMGTPSESSWPGLGALPWYELVRPKEVKDSQFGEFSEKFLTSAGKDLALGLLSYNPSTRLTASDALSCAYFTTELPAPELPSHIVNVKGEWHEMEAKQERAKKRYRESQSGQGGVGGGKVSA